MIREILKFLGKDDLLDQALEECHEMLDMCHQMVTASVESLRHSDHSQIDLDIPRMDKRLNSFERDVKRKVITHLSLGHSADAGSSLALVSIVTDLERIGDYSKNIHGLARNHPGRFYAGNLEERLAAIEKPALDLFNRTVRAFKDDDLEEARQIMVDYKEDVSRQCGDLEETLVAGREELPTKEAVTLALYMRFLKRISAHSRNLISSLVNPFDRLGYPE